MPRVTIRNRLQHLAYRRRLLLEASPRPRLTIPPLDELLAGLPHEDHLVVLVNVLATKAEVLPHQRGVTPMVVKPLVFLVLITSTVEGLGPSKSACCRQQILFRNPFLIDEIVRVTHQAESG